MSMKDDILNRQDELKRDARVEDADDAEKLLYRAHYAVREITQGMEWENGSQYVDAVCQVYFLLLDGVRKEQQ